MPGSVKQVVLVGAVLIGSAAAITSTGAASTAPPSIMTTYFGGTIYPCPTGPCLISIGNKGMPFAAAMVPTFGPDQMSVVSGSLPPGLQLAPEPASQISDEWMITGTPTATGTYTFTIQIVPNAGGPDGYQTFSLTIGSGGADNLEMEPHAAWISNFETLQVAGFDVNVGATYTVYNAAPPHKEIGTLQEINSGDGQPFDGDGHLFTNFHYPPPMPQKITIKDSLGSSVTIPVMLVQQPY